MKFKTLKLKNFMRYKGVNQIDFSCNPEKNVTVVIGDNTVGKTTLAQAFRWCLYGALLMERGKKESDFSLLNNDILASMDANSRASVFVEIIAEDDQKRYLIHREVEYTRIYPRMMSKESVKILKMYISDIDSPNVSTEITDMLKINEVIKELFPMDLSHYFLFDGERWNDFSVDGVKEDIKESVHILTGLSAYREAMRHLKEMGSNSVIKKMKRNITGNGNIYEGYQKELTGLERMLEGYKNRLRAYEVTIERNSKKIEEIELYLENNKNTEELQRTLKTYQKLKNVQGENYINDYKSLVTEFSDKAYRVLALPLIDAATEMVKKVAGERRDIPHMRQASIDYIIKSGKCICGTKILPDSVEVECLLEQRNYLPPADIGSLLGEFEKTGNRWKRSENEIEEKAKKVDTSLREYEESCNTVEKIEKMMDEKIDFAEKREELKNCRNTIQDYISKKYVIQKEIDTCLARIRKVEDQMRVQETRNSENEKWRKRIDFAEALYNRLNKDYSEKEKKIFLELNTEIQKNFTKMFNARDKKIELTENYEIKLSYKTDIAYREEKNLSEGEKVARNFAFIVTIMDYSKRKKMEKNSDETAANDTLPIVLDGPFSKLGEENIALVANVLPRVSEQVIVFMLRKDWEYTGLNQYVGAEYSINKDSDKSYATISKVEVL